MSKLTKPAQVGNTLFGVGIDERIVIERAQREYEYQQTPEKQAERMERVKAFQAQLSETTERNAARYLWLRENTYVEGCYIDGAGGVDTAIRVEGAVHHLDEAIDKEMKK